MRKVVRAIELFLDRCLMVLFVTMVAAIVWQVFARYVLERPTVWSEELARFLVVWVTMLGSALAIRRNGHVTVTVFVELMPPWLQRVVGIVRDGLVVSMAGLLAYYGYGFALAGGRRTSSGLDVPMLYPYAAICVGGVLIGVLVVSRYFVREDDPSC